MATAWEWSAAPQRGQQHLSGRLKGASQGCLALGFHYKALLAPPPLLFLVELGAAIKMCIHDRALPHRHAPWVYAGFDGFKEVFCVGEAFSKRSSKSARPARASCFSSKWRKARILVSSIAGSLSE